MYKHQICVAEKSYRLPNDSTVFMAEVLALTRAAEMVVNFRDVMNIRYVKIHCDSQAALLAVNNRNIRSQTVLDAIRALNRVGELGISLTLVWIKAHVNHEGNEKADALAKAGTTGLGLTVSHLRTPQVVIKNSITEAAYAKWSTDWSSYKHARQTKQFFSEPSSKLAKMIYCLPRTKVSRLVSCITGHGPFGYHQALIEPSIDPMCRFCMYEPRETFHHLMFSCPALANRRSEILGAFELPLDYKWKPAEILTFIDSTRIYEIFELVEMEKSGRSDPEITIAGGNFSSSISMSSE